MKYTYRYNLSGIDVNVKMPVNYAKWKDVDVDSDDDIDAQAAWKMKAVERDAMWRVESKLRGENETR